MIWDELQAVMSSRWTDGPRDLNLALKYNLPGFALHSLDSDLNLHYRKVNHHYIEASRRGASDSVTDSSVLSNPADDQNVSCLGLCGRDICPKSFA